MHRYSNKIINITFAIFLVFGAVIFYTSIRNGNRAVVQIEQPVPLPNPASLKIETLPQMFVVEPGGVQGPQWTTLVTIIDGKKPDVRFSLNKADLVPVIERSTPDFAVIRAQGDLGSVYVASLAGDARSVTRYDFHDERYLAVTRNTLSFITAKARFGIMRSVSGQSLSQKRPFPFADAGRASHAVVSPDDTRMAYLVSVGTNDAEKYELNVVRFADGRIQKVQVIDSYGVPVWMGADDLGIAGEYGGKPTSDLRFHIN
ncbi:MAG: hypothetical protein RLZZ324_609 [Candidatus Parcubacteria bacterium]|jgi:hypothetical protein